MATYRTQPYGRPEDDGIAGPRQQGVISALQGPPTPVAAPPIQADAPVAAPAPSYGKTVGQYGNRLEGFDSGKLNSEHDSPKYQIGRTISNFDPRQGVTPEVLAALNGLNIGKFSGSGDKVSIENGDPRFEGVNSIDLVRGFHDPSGSGGWQFGAENTNAPQAQPRAAGGGGMPSFGGSSINGMLQSDAQGNIQQALGALQQPGKLQQLIAALQGGGQ